MIGWPTWCHVFAWFAVCLWFGFGKLLVFLGAFLLSLPMMLLREDAAVELRGSGDDCLECRFREPEYAEAFALLSHAIAQNTDTIREEFAAAIKSIKQLG